MAALREKLTTIPGVEFGYTQPIQMRVDELISGVKSQIAVKVFGEDLEELAGLGEEVARILSSIEGAVDIKVEAVEGLGYLQIRMHRRRLSRMGISVAQVRKPDRDGDGWPGRHDRTRRGSPHERHPEIAPGVHLQGREPEESAARDSYR